MDWFNGSTFPHSVDVNRHHKHVGGHKVTFRDLILDSEVTVRTCGPHASDVSAAAFDPAIRPADRLVREKSGAKNSSNRQVSPVLII